MDHHLDHLFKRQPELTALHAPLLQVFSVMKHCFSNGGKMLLCGNGGSAADADHWAGELLKGFVLRRALPLASRRELPVELGQTLQGALPAIPLTAFSAFSSAFANDVRPGFAYAQLTWALGHPGDVWVGLSTSGNSPNICDAAETARAKGLATIGLTGQNGGCLAGICDHCLRAPATETFRVQEYHLPLYHTLSLMLEEAFFGTTRDQKFPLES